MPKNILVSALGTSPDIIEETIGFVNYSRHDFYADKASKEDCLKSRAEAGFADHEADELWLVATDMPRKKLPNGRETKSTKDNFEVIVDACSKYVGTIRIFILKGVADIENMHNALGFRDLAFRVIANAKRECAGGKLYISLACGRKTMSADFQDAAYNFGCDAMIHILGNSQDDAYPLFLGSTPRNEALKWDCVEAFDNKTIVECEPSDKFITEITSQRARAQYFFTSYYLNAKESRTNFNILFTLPPSTIARLKTEHLGVEPAKRAEDMEFLRRLPKSELHCHLGGVLSAEEMIEVAKCYRPDIEAAKRTNPKFAAWECHYDGLQPIKQWYNELAKKLDVHKGLIAASLILSYEERASDLHKLIFGKFTDEESYRAIGINAYEKLGDLQGSALLCHEGAIRKTVQTLLERCRRENVKYIEVRCSPINYKTKSLSESDILRAICEELDRAPEIESSIIMIASRHGDESKIKESIELSQRMRDDALFSKYFRGFDLAGDENAKPPQDLREHFIEVMRDCQNITIHAGETAPSENIWQAVYHLTAERIGHGLELENNPELMDKFLERGIGIEMCPSSNFQIVGFADNYFPSTAHMRRYPLKSYLDKELKVSVNTDNPGISITDPTKELLRAARLTPGGLSKWDILQLICNGFRTAFYPYDKKKRLIAKVEELIGKLIENNQL